MKYWQEMNLVQQISCIVGVTLLATFLIIALAATMMLATDIVLLIFLAILFGVFLTKTSAALQKLMPGGYGWSLGVVTTLLLILTIGGLTLFGISIERRLDTLTEQLDQSGDNLNKWIDEHPFVKTLVQRVPFVNQIVDGSDADSTPFERVSKGRLRSPKTDNEPGWMPDDSTGSGDVASAGSQNATGESGTPEISTTMIQRTSGRVIGVIRSMFTTTLGLVANLGVVFFIGIFVAANPRLYRDGFAKLFPLGRRERVIEILDEMGDAMFAWLLGRFLAMLITGVGTAATLWLLGVPMAISIGVITGLLTFIPNIGGIIALLLASVMALTQGPMTLLWVVIAYALLQLIESNVITPLVQQHQTSIPPALLIAFQVTLGGLTGFLGLLVSTPFLAALLVLVREVWIRDTLEDEHPETVVSAQ